jgi:hypothetical protein
MNIVITITAESPAEAQRALLALAFPGSPSQQQSLGQVTSRREPLAAEGALSPVPAPAPGNGRDAVELIEVADLPVPEETAEPPLQSGKRKLPPKSKYKAKAAPPKAKPEPEPELELVADEPAEPDDDDDDGEDDLDMTKVRAMIVRYHQAFDEASTAALLKLHGNGCLQLSKLDPKLFRKVYNAARLALPADFGTGK